MRFEVSFRSVPGYAVRLLDRHPGLRLLDQVRVAFGPSVQPGQVNDLPGVYRNPTVFLTENQARASGHFDEPRVGAVEVRVPAGSLNDYVRLEPSQDDDGIVWWVPVIDEAGIVQAWAAAGYPLEWDPEAKTPEDLREMAREIDRVLMEAAAQPPDDEVEVEDAE